MSVINLVDKSISEVLVLYGGKDDANFEIVDKDGNTCTSNIPSPPVPNMDFYGWTTRKDRYFIMCGGCDCNADCNPNSCTSKIL